MAPNRGGGRQRGNAGGSVRQRGGRGGSNNAAAHIQARQERRKAAGGPKSIHDVFEYATKQIEGQKRGRAQKRAKANLMDDGEERSRQAEASDDGVEQDYNLDYGTAPILGGDGVDSDEDIVGKDIASDDDEDIDSDEAMGDSDAEPFDDMKYDKQKRAADRRRAQATKASDSEMDDGLSADDDEDSGSDASINDADLVDLSRILDGDSQDGKDDDDEDNEAQMSDDDDDDDERHAKLQRRMEEYSRAGAKRAAEDDSEEDGNVMTKALGKRRVLKDRVEAMPESDWNAPALRTEGGQGLTIDDLMKPITEEGGTAMTSIRRAAKILRSANDDEEGREAVASRRGGTKLSAPLSTVIQDRLDRSAAYQESKEEVEGWQATIKQLREAPHLSFPLQPDPVQRPTTAALAAHHKPTNAFEQNIASLLQREGATEKQMQQAEELKMNERGMSADEIRQRTAELRKMRELLFREEQKAKRVSKIKSKTYRRIARKEKQRDMEKAREAGLLVEGDLDEDEDERRLKAERLRAKERATLKHKNAGKWAKNTLNAKGLQDIPEARQAIEEQLLRGEQLRRRIHGQNDEDDSDEDDVVVGDSDESDSGDEGVRRRAFDEMATVHGQAEEQKDRDERDAGENKKGVWNMKFMREARDRQAKDSEEQMSAFMKEMNGQGTDDDTGSGNEDDLRGRVLHVGDNAGRMTFNVVDGKGAASRSIEKDPAVQDSSMQENSDRQSSVIQVQDVRPTRSSKQESEEEEEVNPWLVSAGNSKLSRKKNEASVSKDGNALSKAANRVSRHAAKGKDAQGAREADGELVIDPNAVIDLQQKKRNEKQATMSDSDDNSDVERDVEEVSRRHPNAIRQRDLVAEAFAGDDVLANFASEKAAAVETEAPQEIDTFLTGWGSWGGKGVRKNKKRDEERRKRFTKWTSGVDPSKRKDAKMDNVIINQKRDKKADKYKADDVPFPFTSRAQYEMAMRNPLGPEWNTRTQHQRLTLPRVVTKPGKAIKPIEKMF